MYINFILFQNGQNNNELKQKQNTIQLRVISNMNLSLYLHKGNHPRTA